jgi:hypothetical protein
MAIYWRLIMRNSDMPAMPQSGSEGSCGDLNSSADWGGMGLTKREYFAGLAMQGFCSNPNANPTIQAHIDNLAEDSVNMADALLEQLTKGVEA